MVKVSGPELQSLLIFVVPSRKIRLAHTQFTVDCIECLSFVLLAQAPADVAPPGTESAPQDGTADDEDSDDDSEDDDVQITIGDIKSGPPAFP